MSKVISLLKELFIRKVDKDELNCCVEKSIGVISSYTIVGYLGAGSFGQVFRVKDNNNLEYALKIVPPGKNWGPKMQYRELEALVKLQEANHPNILTYENSGLLKQWPITNLQSEMNLASFPSHHAQVLFIVTELGSSTLEQFLLLTKNDMIRRNDLNSRMKRFGLQLASALKYIHDQDIFHRDLTLSNIILLQGDYCVKIADYGLSRFKPGLGRKDTHQSMTTDTRRNPYMSPDLWIKEYDEKCDVYSLGVIFLAMYHRTYWEPVIIRNQEDLEKLVQEIPEERLRNLTLGMLSWERDLRPTSQTIYNQMEDLNNK